MEDWKHEPARDLDLDGMDRLRSYRRESGLFESVLRLGWWATLRATFAVWNRLTIHGREHLPLEPPFVLVANHASHLDALVLASMLPLKHRDRIFPLAAKDVFFERESVARLATTFINAMPLWRRGCRGQGLLELRERLVADKAIYILFPEGTRSRTGEIAPFKPGVGMLLAGVDVPVIPCHLSGTFAALPPTSSLPCPSRITIRIGPPLSFQATPNERAGWDELAKGLEDAVGKLKM